MSSATAIHPVAALTAALILALVLTANFFYFVQRLELPGHRRNKRAASWRRILAYVGAASLPAFSALLAMALASAAGSSTMVFIGACCMNGLMSHRLMEAMLTPRSG